MFFPTKDKELVGIFDHLFSKNKENYDVVFTKQSSVHHDSKYEWSGAEVLVRPNTGTSTTDNFVTDSVENSNFTILFNIHHVK